MTYVIDGMPISDQLTGAFGNGVDSSIVQNIELFTGDIPAEFGSKVSGVANITTRSGLNSNRRFFGSTEVSASQFDQLANVTQFGGQAGRFGYFASLSAQKSNRFLDQVSRDNLHNGGNAERGFARLDYQIGTADFLRRQRHGRAFVVPTRQPPLSACQRSGPAPVVARCVGVGRATST